jgi:thiol-disulfide isomerase/thioredoxin
MKNIILVFACILAFGAIHAQGIQFAEGSWKEILAEAGRQNKIVFVDAYTTWCGPCKMMDRNTFPNKEVGEFFNANFINAKIDMEKGEGPTLAQEYGVRAYPSFLFVDADGALVHRSLGYQEASAFLITGKAAADPERRLSALNARYAGGDRSPEFLRKYTESRAATMDGSHLKVAEEYLQTQKDWTTEENMEFLFQYAEDANSPMFDFLFKNRVAFEDMFGEEMVRGKIQQAAFSDAMKTPNMLPEAAVAKMNAFFKEKCPDIAPRLGAETAMSVYRMTGNTDLYAKTAVSYYEQYPTDNYLELNEVAWAFFETVDDKAMLQKGLNWGLKSISISNEYFNNDTVAALYYKLGNKKQAMKYAKKAIAIAKKNGEDDSETQALLPKIKAMKK